jgi:hypothetical protein
LELYKSLGKSSGPKKVAICEHYEIDALAGVASFVAIINPHSIIFCNDEVDKEILDKIAIGSSKYLPSEHLQCVDCLNGLPSLGPDLMMNGTSK